MIYGNVTESKLMSTAPQIGPPQRGSESESQSSI
jgi:hypothetical protein